MPINSPLVKAIGRNLRGKAFRFGIFRAETWDLEPLFSLCLDEEIGRRNAWAGMSATSSPAGYSNADQAGDSGGLMYPNTVMIGAPDEGKGVSVRKITVSRGLLL